MNLLKRHKKDKDKDGSRDLNNHEESPVHIVDVGDAEADGKASMTDKVSSFMKPYLRKNKDGSKDGSKGVEDAPPPNDDDDDDKEEEEESERPKPKPRPGAKESMTDKVTTFMTPYLKQARSWTTKEASDAKKELQKYAGLGERPDVIPPGEALVSGEPRTVELGWVSI